MLESEPRRLLLVACVVGLALTAAPVSATLGEQELQEVGDTLQDVRNAAADTAPRTGTEADGLLADVLEPEDDPADPDDARDEAADHAPETGTEADDVVDDAVRSEGDPDAVSEAQDAARPVVAATIAVVNEVRDTLGDDPLRIVDDQVEPIRDAANEMLPRSDAYEVEDPAPASGEATAMVPASPELIMASSAAAAAAALVILWLVSSGSAGAAGATGATTAGAAGSELRRLLPFASPLFTRFEKDTVLGHPKREALYALILQDPGVSLQSLCDSTGLSRTAVTHHLRLLEMQHLIVSKRMGRSRHYYENGGRFGRDQKDAYAVLHNARSKDVARYVRDHPGAIQKAVCTALGIQPSIAHWHLRRLQEAQLVEAVRHGRTVSYFPGMALKSLDNPVVPPGPAPLPAPAPAPLPFVRASPA